MPVGKLDHLPVGTVVKIGTDVYSVVELNQTKHLAFIGWSHLFADFIYPINEFEHEDLTYEILRDLICDEQPD